MNVPSREADQILAIDDAWDAWVRACQYKGCGDPVETFWVWFKLTHQA